MSQSFLDINSRQDLASFLDISLEKLLFNAYKVDSKYNEFFIKKRNGKERRILSPIPSLKSIQYVLANEITEHYKPKRQVHSYLKNKGIRTNANIHVGQKNILNIDLEDFFPSINFGRIRGVFTSYPFKFNIEVANILAQLCCHNNELPQGSPTSPILSNFICRNLDNEILKLSKKNRCYYSRYADDITISTNLNRFPKSIAVIRNDVVEINSDVLNIINKNGFTINASKSSLRKWFENQYVTGLTVNKKLNVKRKYIKQLRAMLYAWDKFGLDKAAKEHFEKYSTKRYDSKSSRLFVKIIEGKLLFLSDIRGKDDQIFKKYLAIFQRLSPNKNLQNYLSYQGEKILVFTEGNTDWMHLKRALDYFVTDYKYVNLKKAIKIVEYNPNFSVGDSKLKELLRAHLVSGRTIPIIGVFDSDNIGNLGEFIPIKEKKYNNFDNRVYTFYLPKPSHRRINKNCIEHYYKDSDLKIKDTLGRRLFLSNEFDSESGIKLDDNKIRCHLGRKKLGAVEGIIDNDVRNEKQESLALSKKDFATNIMNNNENYKKVDFKSFRLIFDIMIDIIKDIELSNNQRK